MKPIIFSLNHAFLPYLLLFLFIVGAGQIANWRIDQASRSGGWLPRRLYQDVGILFSSLFFFPLMYRIGPAFIKVLCIIFYLVNKKKATEHKLIE